MNKALVIGLDASGPDGLAPHALDLVRSAEVLAGGKRHLAYFPEHPAQRIEIAADAASATSAIKTALAEDKRTVVLASGDPLLFGIGATLIRHLGRDQVEIVPAPSSVQQLFAASGEPWHDAVVLSAHGRPIDALLPAALAAQKAAILTDADHTPARIAQALFDAGMEDCRVLVGERLGSPDQRLTDTTLHDLTAQTFDALNVVALIRQPNAPRLAFGRPDEDYVTVRGQLTHAEVRAVTLSKLCLAPHGVLWDVGAGSGALSIEAARLMPHGRVFAIERDPDQIACIRANLTRHGAGNVTIVDGEAPESLRDLPQPDAVFLGGSGGRLAQLLGMLPRPLVANFAVLEHVTATLTRFPKAEAVELQVSRSSPIAGGHRLAALNPVFIVTVRA